ncbi:hypothetical protein [Sorangium sp. So ce1099]|uniref:hypothetical protein n=1 Tax=Sorangium sp. So ce1099 TaxID=3133331 RepID=UPI003F600280
MTTTVYELMGSMRNIAVDDELIFPNVQTCIALVAVAGGQMVGVHVTIADIERMSQVAEAVKRQGTVTDIYVVGPITPMYNVSSFANLGGTLHVHDTPGFIDVRARMVGSTVTFEKRSTAGHAWQEIPITSFYP